MWLKPVNTMSKVVFVLAALFSFAAGFSTFNFTETRECQGDQVCLYDYVVEQQHFAGEGQQNISITSEVEIVCNSVGLYNGENAVLYCMTIRDLSLQGTMFEDEDDETEQAALYRQQHLFRVLAGRFCFVQTADGKIASVYYTAAHSDEAVNFKKAIAAAFQANFKGTETEEEVDPQSMHSAHYKFKESNQDGTVKMHRTVNGEDVTAYSTGAPRKDIKLTREEDVEYESGKLHHSAGNTSVKLAKDDDSEEDGEDLSRLFSAEGSYSLDLKQCSPIAKRAYARHRRSVVNDLEGDGIEDSLRMKYNETKGEIEEMELLRERLPSVTDALSELSGQNPNDSKIVDLIEQLLGLERKHGSLPGFSSALADVLEFFSSIQGSGDPSDEAMRLVIYSLLSAEGSYQSQMILFDALQTHDVSEEERVALINEIGMLTDPHLDLVQFLKEHLLSVFDDLEKAEPLLLSFGALASEASVEVEEFVANFLLELNTNIDIDAGNESLLTPLILAMGNTGSSLVTDSLLSYVESPDKEIQQRAIQALQKFVLNKQVLEVLEVVLADQDDEEILAAVVGVLVSGLEYSTNLDIDGSSSQILSSHSILTTLVKTSLECNDTSIRSLVQNFLKTVGGEQAYTLLDQFESLTRRATDWDESNSIYNLVASYSERQSDVTTYSKHRAYIWGKQFGITQANIEIAAGGFGGISSDCNNIKAFGRAIAKGTLLSNTRTFADVTVNLRKTPTHILGRVYVNLFGNTLVDYSRSYALSSLRCYNYEQRLYERRFRVFRISHSVFVYVATLRLSVEMHVTLRADFDAEICGQTAGTELATATAGFTPRVGASVSGGISANLLSLARGGIRATATFTYQLEPRATAEACRRSCSLQYRACMGVYDSWPDNTLDIETWYQTRTVRTCGGWIKIPCGIRWGRRRRWDAFSWTWSLGSRPRRALIESCRGTTNPQCSSVSNPPPSPVPSSCSHGGLRLVGGSSSREGRVEFCNRGTWGTVCDDGWSATDARVVCRQLGFTTTGAQAFSNARFGQGTGSIWLDDVGCSGGESRLISCPARSIGSHNCGHSEDAGVRCGSGSVSVSCSHGGLRLVGGSSSREGRVEFCNRGTWGTVCDDGWSATDARVVCRQLGFTTTGAQAFSNALFGRGTGSIWLDDVGCSGGESRLINCPARLIGSHNCGHSEDAGVRCGSGTVSVSCSHGSLRLVGGTSSREGRVEFCNRGTWGTVCDDSWDINDARVVCRQLGYSTNAQAFSSAHFGQGTGSIWLDNVFCLGGESRLISCRANPIGSHNCGHYEDAGVRCG